MITETYNSTDIFRFQIRFKDSGDPRSAGYLADAVALGFANLEMIECQDLVFLAGRLSEQALQVLAARLFCDSITQQVVWYPAVTAVPTPPGSHIIEVALRPGVTDPVAAEILRAAGELGITGLESASTGMRFVIRGGTLSEATLHLLAKRLLANPVIHRYTLGCIEPAFASAVVANSTIEVIRLRDLNDEELLQLSRERRAALDLTEMRAIQVYCQAEGRDLTDVEFECIAQTWSEHCVHKTFKARVEVEPASSERIRQLYPGLVVDNLMQTYLRRATKEIAAPWVISAFQDNAGIINLDGSQEVSFKVETHNHPSAIEPFGGANTGVGGVIRDIIGVSAKPVAATDILCFGPQNLPFEALPEGVLHPRRIFSGVVAGVQDYGNKIGLPTVNGAILYDQGYTANPLVYCGCVGIAPRGAHRRQPQPADRVVVLGGRTGRDGLRGATFSSQMMDAQTGEVAGASVQIGMPITEKGLIDVCVAARDEELYSAITDCGAGGLSSAVGEMASHTGAEVDLSLVPLKYAGLTPWEIWLSEAQERMVVAVPPEKLPRLEDICATYGVELTDIGEFTSTDRLVARHGSQVVLDLANSFLHDGIPQRNLKACIPEPLLTGKVEQIPDEEPQQVLLDLLAHPNIASKEDVIRIYDHEVQGGTALKPLVGAMDDAPSDAAVLKPITIESTAGIVLSNGINPEYGKIDPFCMAMAVIDEAVRNAVAAGADPDRLAILDNFCWGDPNNPTTLGTLLEALRGCYEAAILHRTPFISGKDSLNNEYLGMDGKRHAIPPSLLISGISVIDDVQITTSMDLKIPGNPVYLVGEFQPSFGGSHYNLVRTPILEAIPAPSRKAPIIYRSIYRAIQNGWVKACHDLSEGGLGVAAAEMSIGGRLGLNISLDTLSETPLRTLFGETTGCLLVEVDAMHEQDFNSLFEKDTCHSIGITQEKPSLNVNIRNKTIISLSIADLLFAWKRHPWE